MHLKTKIEQRTAVVGVIGLGYVGLASPGRFPQGGISRHRASTSIPGRSTRSNGARTTSSILGPDLVRDMPSSGRFDATTDVSRLGEADAIISCVPTPLGPHLEPDLSFVEKSADDIARTLRPGQLVVLESSTYPGTTREVMLPRLQTRGLKSAGATSSSPTPPSGKTPAARTSTRRRSPSWSAGSTRPAASSPSPSTACAIKQVVPVSTAEVAEAAKILENIYRAVNIALVNEMKTVLTAMGIDIWEVIAAASTKPFGFQPFYPGPGLGGHCIPIDPVLPDLEGARSRHAHPLHRAGRRGQPRHARTTSCTACSGPQPTGKAVNGSRILVLGLAYKPDVDDVRESPSFELIEKLEAARRSRRLQRPARPRHAQDAPLRPEDAERHALPGVASPATTASWSPRTTRRTTGR